MSTTETIEAPTDAAPAPAKKVRGPRSKRVGLTAEQQELVTQYIPLARSLTRPLKLRGKRLRDEFDSAADMALVEAAQAFDPGRGVRFSTFARFRIIGALYDIQRVLIAKEYPKELPNVPRSQHFVPGTDERNLLMLTSPDEPVGTDLEGAEEVERWLRSLTPRQARACRELYVNRLSQGEAGAAMGCAKSRVCTLHAEAIEALRRSPAVREAALAIGLDVGRN